MLDEGVASRCSGTGGDVLVFDSRWGKHVLSWADDEEGTLIEDNLKPGCAALNGYAAAPGGSRRKRFGHRESSAGIDQNWLQNGGRVQHPFKVAPGGLPEPAPRADHEREGDRALRGATNVVS